jgi:hypothetical protein
MNDHDILELRRIVADDPISADHPDLPRLIRSGRRRLVRRRTTMTGAALGAAAAIAVPIFVVAGGTEAPGTAADRGDVAGPANQEGRVVAPRLDGCGMLSCFAPEAGTVEPGTVLGELPVGTSPGGEQEQVYVVNTDGVDLGTGQEGRVDVLKAGYRVDGELHSTVWALQPGYDGDSPVRFWMSPGLINAPIGAGGRYVVIGYVDGTPDQISWSTPDGRSGDVDGMKAMDGYTIFYLTRPLPADYDPPSFTRKKDGSFKVHGSTDTDFSPRLTIQTSDGWSCSLEECGSMG